MLYRVSHFDLLLTDKKWKYSRVFSGWRTKLLLLQCFSSRRRSDFSRKCVRPHCQFVNLDLFGALLIWNSDIKDCFLFQGETDKGAQRMMQRNRQIPGTVPSIWMASLPDNLGLNEHIAMPLTIYHNVDNFFTRLFLWQYYYFCNYKRSRLMIPNMHFGKM